MGRTITPKYVVQLAGGNGIQGLYGFTEMAWRGTPSAKKLEKFVMEHVVSTMPGFCNEHIGKTNGITIPAWATIRLNDGVGGKKVAEWRAPMFMVLPNPTDYPNVAKVVR